MKTLACALLGSLLAGLGSTPSTQPNTTPQARKSMTVAELQRTDVIGRLDIQLGRCVPILAVLISGDSLESKAETGRYLLRVIEVEGRTLVEPQLFRYSNAPGFDGLPLNQTDHAQRVHGEQAAKLSAEDEARLERDFVGTERRLVAYEVGEFSGIPTLPKNVAEWQDRAFGFSTSLVLVQCE
ncbi:MAG: hypothetical protein U0638_16055 [Phycisphaerales bacterium]